MKYRPEIDGLRALAVTPVIFFHAGFAPFSGGYIGVDVFFVISGYLITRLISAEITRGEFSFAGFYERRARRILPVLFLVCLVCIPIGWQLLVPEEFSELGLSIVAVAAFVSNLYFWSKGDYFAAPTESYALHHTWSLAVEEQFYFLFPLLLLHLTRRGTTRRLGVLLIGSLASLLLAEVGSRFYPSATFYLIPTRGWELGAGAIVALSERQLFAKAMPYRGWLAAAGLFAVMIPMVAFDADTRHPSLVTLVPVLGTMALIVTATPATIVGRFLTSGPLVSVGLISYSAYLWHQPLFFFARTYAGTPSPSLYGTLIALTLVLAGLSWKFIEQPFRGKSWIPRRAVLPLTLTGGAALLTAGMVAHTTELDWSRLESERQFVAHWARDKNPTYMACIFRQGDGRQLSEACIRGAQGRPKVAVVGDSHAAAIADQLARQLDGSGLSLIELTHVACPPAQGLSVSTEKGRGCAEFNAAVAERLQADDIDTVVMLARWSQYLLATSYDNGYGVTSGWRALAEPIDTRGKAQGDKERINSVSHLYVEAVTRLLGAGKRVVLVYPVPEIGWETPREMARRRRVAIGEPEVVSIAYNVFVERNEAVYAAFDTIRATPNLVRVKPERLFCNSVLQSRCVAEMDGKPLYWDDSHLNQSVGAKLLTEEISEAMSEKWGWR